MTENNRSVGISQKFDEELERAIVFLQDPFGDEIHQRAQLRATQFLLKHPDESHPRLLKLLQSGGASNPYAIVEVLPRFGLLESVPVLEELLTRGPVTLSASVGQALAKHPLNEALLVLLRALTSPKKEVVIAAADALMSRGDSSACSGLKKILSHPERELRYHVIQAAASLGCLDSTTLAKVARNDQSTEIRELANLFIGRASNRLPR